MITYESLIDIIKNNNINNKGITFIINENESRYFSYNEIYSKSLGILYDLQCSGIKPGDELVFQIEDNQWFILLFWACLLGGIIPVPVTVGNNDEHRLKLFKILEVLNKPNLIGGKETLETLKKFADCKLPGKIKDKIKYNVISLDELENIKELGNALASGIIYKAHISDIAFIQFSSGSTGDPKGVVLTHENLLTNINAMISRTGMDSHDSMLSWMPLTHDMGLILVHLTGLVAGVDQYLMPTTLFIKHPVLWLEKAHQLKATQLYSPNFGFKHFLTYFNLEAAKHWDLSHVRLIYNGAEPISAGICNDFLDRMQMYGLKRNCMFTVYGLAEASVGVSSPPPGEEFVTYNLDRQFLSIGQTVKETDGKDDKCVEFVDVGSPIDDCYARICDETDRVLGDNTVGYIQIKGKNVTHGYYNNSEATAKAFTEDGWLNTGDLGFMWDGRIVITGRAKDIVFVNGQNYYPHDIERVAEDIDGIELGKAAACGVFNKEEQKEDIIVFVLFKKKLEDFIPLAINLKNHISKQMGLEIKEAIPVKKMPRTTSGKVQRYKLGEMYENGEFSYVVREIEILVDEEVGKRKIDNPENEIEQKLVEIWEEVLGIKRIGINDSFFEMGGHSLKAANLISRIQKTFNVEVPLSEIFKNPTVKKLAENITQAGSSIYSPIRPAVEKEYYPVSSAQKRIFLLNQHENIHTAYNIPVALAVEGRLEKGRLERAFKALIKRHGALRTSFGLVDGEVVQRVHKEVDFEITYIEAEEDEIKDIVKGFIRPFDLKKAPLLRIGLIGLAKDKYILLFDMHHIISDGVSAGIFVKEFAGLYEGRDLPESRIQYKDFAVWEREQLKTGVTKKQEEYWLNKFGGEIPVLNMPTDYLRPSMRSFEGSSIDFDIDKELSDGLSRLAPVTGTTLYMVLLAAFNILLSKYTGQEDIIVGSPFAGRRHTDVEQVIGMFANTLSIRNYPEHSKTFGEFLTDVKENYFKVYENQNYQFEELIEKVDVRRDLSRNPLFDAMFVLQNMDNIGLEVAGLKINPCKFDNRVAKFDLTLSATEGKKGIEFNLEYCTRLFRKETIEKLARYFTNILSQIVKNPDIRLSEIDMLSEEEKRLVLYEFNNTKAEYPRNKTIQELFEEQVENTPDNIALVFESGKLTYRELNEKSNHIARILRGKGVKPDSITGIMTEHSPETITGMLGILKAGGAYLPIDPEYSQERIKYILEDSGAGILLTQQRFMRKVKFEGEIINLENNALYNGDSSNLKKVNKPTDLVYVIYTSGSTGKPKGVMITHRGLVNYIWWAKKVYLNGEDLDFPLYSSISFDLTVTSIYTPLISGNKVVVYGGEEKSQAIKKILEDNKVGIIKLTPTHLKLLEGMKFGRSNLRKLIVGGEDLKTGLAKKIYESFGGNIEIYNEYGPTETVVGCMIYKYSPEKDTRDSVPIGVPADNVQVYLLDRHLNPVPAGVDGEIYVSGDGVARGYINRTELTTECFVPNPYMSGKRMYRTGDVVRRLPDGNIEFVGRMDSQVKIRGYRIELGEIESQLLKNELIKEAIVTAKEDIGGNKYLCAYIVSYEYLMVSELRECISKELPDYMVPSYFVQLEKIPLTPNGKVDTRALPEPEGSINTGVKYAEPNSGIEKKLAEIWQQVLGIKRIGIKDNFFELGGDSIKALQVTSSLHKYGLNLEIKHLLQHPRITELSSLVKPVGRDIDQGVVEGEAGLTPIQKWFFEQKNTDINHFNQSVMLYSRKGFDEKLIRKVFDKITGHHDALRMIYKTEAGRVVQYNRGMAGESYSLNVINLSAEANCADKIEEEANKLQCSINLKEGPLVKLGLFRTMEGDHLLIIIHHLVVDGVSLRILLEDLATGYVQVMNNEEIELQDKTDSFREWSDKLQNYADSKELLKELEYWNRLEGTDIAPLQKDNIAKENKVKDSDTLSMTLSEEETEKLLNDVNQAYNTQINDILLTALGLSLKDHTGEDDVLITLEGHGREEIIDDVDITRTVGWFTTAYPVLMDMRKSKDLSYQIKAVKEYLRHVPNRGIGYGILKYLTHEENKSVLKFSLKPEISFNYLGQFDRDMETGVFTMSPYGTGQTVSPDSERQCSFDINGMIAGGRLTLTFSYNKYEYSKSTVSKLMDNYKRNLSAIIDHCAGKEERELSPSDLDYSKLSIEELSRINKLIKNK